MSFLPKAGIYTHRKNWIPHRVRNDKYPYSARSSTAQTAPFYIYSVEGARNVDGENSEFSKKVKISISALDKHALNKMKPDNLEVYNLGKKNLRLPRLFVIGAKQGELVCSGEEGRSANLGFEDSQERMRSSQIAGAIAPIERHLIVGFGHIQKRSRSRANCADAPSWTGLRTNVVLDEDRKIFEPECQNIDCLECLRGRVYSDREIGFYCMITPILQIRRRISPVCRPKPHPAASGCGLGKYAIESDGDNGWICGPILMAILVHTLLGSMFLSLLCREHAVPGECGRFYNESGEAKSRELTVCALPTSMRHMLNAAQSMVERIPFNRFLFPAIFVGFNFFSFALFFSSTTRRTKMIKPTDSKQNQRQLSLPFDDSQN